MPVTIGITPEGFSVPTIQELIDDTAQRARDAIDPALDTGPTSVIGEIIGIVEERAHEVIVGERDVYVAFTPGGSTGISQTQLSAITGTIREDATFSVVGITLNLNAGVTVLAGSQVRVPDSDFLFALVADVTNSGGSPANVAGSAKATQTGPVRANSGTLTEIVSPVSGWNTVTNALDAELGRDAETDTALRQRTEDEKRAQGSANIDAIAERVLKVTGVIDVLGEENDTDATVGGIPAHAFHIVVWDGTGLDAADDAIAQSIWESKPAGIRSSGAASGNATDSRGRLRAIAFDRATQKDVYLVVGAQIDESIFPTDGAAQIKQALVDYAATAWSIGKDVYRSALMGPIFSISGVVNVTVLNLGFAPAPGGTADLSVAATEIALADTSRIVVAVA
jgi:uncharacterized phage protein gp47/JayE